MNNLDQYKIVFIKEDEIEYYGDNLPNTFHSIYLKEYIDKYYKEHPFLGKLTVASGVDVLAYSLVYITKTAIVLNVTKYGDKHYAIVELPSNISAGLETNLMNFAGQLKDYSNVLFEEVYVDNSNYQNILSSKPIKIDDGLSIEDKFKCAIEGKKRSCKNKI